MKNKEKFELRIYVSENKEARSIESDTPFILPRVGDLIDAHNFVENYTPGQKLEVTSVAHHLFLQDNLILEHQQISIKTKLLDIDTDSYNDRAANGEDEILRVL